MAPINDPLQTIETPALRIAYRDPGSKDAQPIILLHGFPYDIHAYDDVVESLLEHGHRPIIPYLRGYGMTEFLSNDTLRSGEQAVLGNDLAEFMDALSIDRAILGGYDWGGRAACIVSALWPERVHGLVTVNGYNVQHIASANRPAEPVDEHRFWYQYYFHSERGRAGLEKNRYELCKLLWTLWSPHWSFSESTYAESAKAFDNPDFVDVVIHSYRHRFGLVDGDPRVADIEAALGERPPITVPTVSIDGRGDGVIPATGSSSHERFFTGPYRYLALPKIGHNVPQEAPGAFADAINSLT